MATVTPDCNPCFNGGPVQMAQAIYDELNAQTNDQDTITNNDQVDDNKNETPVIDNNYFVYSMVIFGFLSLLIIIGLVWRWKYYKATDKKLKIELESMKPADIVKVHENDNKKKEENESDQNEEERERLIDDCI